MMSCSCTVSVCVCMRVCVCFRIVRSNMCMSHVTHMSELDQIREWVKSHVWMSRIKHVFESCLAYAWVRSNSWMSHVTCRWKPRLSFPRTLHTKICTCTWRTCMWHYYPHIWQYDAPIDRQIDRYLHICIYIHTYINTHKYTYVWVYSHTYQYYAPHMRGNPSAAGADGARCSSLFIYVNMWIHTTIDTRIGHVTPYMKESFITLSFPSMALS